MKEDSTIKEIKNENFKSFAYANLVLATFEKDRRKFNDINLQDLDESNSRMKNNLENKILDLEVKMTELENIPIKVNEELKTQSSMIYKLFETIDHKFLKLDYLDSKSQNLELEDIAYFLKVLDHEIMDYENIIQSNLSVHDIVASLKPKHKEAI